MSHCSLALSRHPPRSAARVIVRFCEIHFSNTLNRALRVQIVKSGRNALKFWPDLQKILMNPGNMRRAGGARAREHSDHISERVEFFDMFWGPNLRSYIFRGNLRYFPTQNWFGFWFWYFFFYFFHFSEKSFFVAPQPTFWRRPNVDRQKTRQFRFAPQY